jgi:ribonuclease J
LVLSHGHADHWGLAVYTAHLPIITGAATRRMLRAAAPFVPRPIPEGIDAAGLPDLLDRGPSRSVRFASRRTSSITRLTTPTHC